jgi:hypothetical protein
MSTKLQINVPDISTVIATYNVIRVFRSVTTRDGPFVEVTAASTGAAKVVGTISGPFTSLNGKTIILRLTTQTGTRPDIAVSFTDPNPISIVQVCAAINAVTTGLIVATDGGAGQLRMDTVATGPSTKLEVVGGSGLADLGLALYQADVGEDPFIPLVAGQTTYELVDPAGTDQTWYRWQFFHTISLATSAVNAAIQPPAARIDPVRKIEDARSTRGLTLIRGREQVFRMAFWEDQERNIPLVPFDAARYPSYVVFDPNGTTIQTGRAEVDGTTPNYKVPFTPAVDALLTNDDRRWRIDWFMLTESGRSVQSSELFDMRDVDITETEVKELKYLALDGAKKRMRLPLPKRPTSLTLQVSDANSQTTLLPLPAVFPPSGPNPSLTEIQEGDRYVYVYDVAPGLLLGGVDGKTYRADWTVLQTPTSEEDNIFQIIEVPPPAILQFFPALRMGIDKFQKQRHTLQAYQDSDVYEYLRRGLQIVNGYDPVHLTWNQTTVPSQVQPYWLLASMWWGLNAQQGLEIDLSFGFSGQSVTLDYDHASALEGYGAKMMDFINTKFGPLKKQLYRSRSSVGAYSGRSLRRSGVNNYVFQISHDQSPGVSNFLGILTQIGLI